VSGSLTSLTAHAVGLTGNQFNISLAVFYVLYIVCEIPSNLVLKTIGGNIWIPAIVRRFTSSGSSIAHALCSQVIAWGVVTTLTSLVQNYAGLLAIRIMLGACEGGVLPGIVVYQAGLYPRHELQFRVRRRSRSMRACADRQRRSQHSTPPPPSVDRSVVSLLAVYCVRAHVDLTCRC
jgi:MFS family permease